MELGIYTFAELTPDPGTGHTVSAHQRLRDLIEEIELADQVGLDVFGVGEHHRPDFAVSAPAVVLAAAAERTKDIKLSSAVSVLSSDDPVRVFQDFATLDLLSRRPRRDHGRPRHLHRVVPAVRLRPRRLQRAVRREARAAHQDPRAEPRLLGRRPPRGDRRARRLPAPLPGRDPDLGRRRRHARVGGARRPARPADGARDHRRPARALRADGRSLPPRGGAGRARRRREAQHQLARPDRRRPARRRPTSPSRRSPR